MKQEVAAMAVFTKTELDTLIRAYIGPMEPGTKFGEEDVVRWVRWCQEAKVSAALVGSVLRERMDVSWPAGSEAPVFTTR